MRGLWLSKPNPQDRRLPMAEMSPLRRRMIEDMTVRNLSPATQRSYVHAVAKFSRHFGCSPDRLDLEKVRAFQVHLVANGISWPALNQTVCALRFFYGVTLGHREIPERIPYAREPRKLPVVLSADEVVRLSTRRCTHRGIAPPLMCWSLAPTSASFRCSWAMPTCRARRAIRGFRTGGSDGWNARSTGCRWKSSRPPDPAASCRPAWR